MRTTRLLESFSPVWSSLLTPMLRCAPEESLAYATAQAKLAAGPALRRNYMAIKHKAKGQVARMVMVNHRPPSNGGSRSKHC